MTIKTICLLGGSGFVGYHLANQLTRAGYRIRIPSRRRERHRQLLVMPTVDVIETDIHDKSQLERLVGGCEIVINLVAILNERRKGDFQRVHIDLVQKVVDACTSQGFTRLLHMSSLNADAKNGASNYLRTKGRGEDIAHASAGLDVTSFRPSVIFGPNDHFFNMFAALLKRSPLFFPVVCPQAKFAPIFVEDVAAAFLTALQDPRTIGQRYNLCGPTTYTMQQLIEYSGKITGNQRSLIPLGNTASRLMAAIMARAPGKPLSTDNYRSMQVDSVCAERAPILAEKLTPVEAVVPLYVGQKSQKAHYDQHRYHARHEA